MLKKIIAAVLVLAVLAVVPMTIGGCHQNEYKKTTIHNEQKTVSQDEVVD